MHFLEILQVYRIRQHDSTCVQNTLPWQLKEEQWSFVEKTKTNCLYKCIDNFSMRDNTIYQPGYNFTLLFHKVKLVLNIVYCRFTIGFVISSKRLLFSF